MHKTFSCLSDIPTWTVELALVSLLARQQNHMLPSYNVVMVCTVLKSFSPDLMELATFFCLITQTSTLLTQTWTQISTIQTIKLSGTSSATWVHVQTTHTTNVCPYVFTVICFQGFFIKSSDCDIPLLATELFKWRMQHWKQFWSFSTHLFLSQTEVMRLLVQTLFRLRQPLCIQDYVRLCCSIMTRLQRCFDPASTELLCLFL